MASLVEIPQSKSTATLEVLGHLGITQEHFKLLRSDPLFAKRVAEFMIRGGQEEYFHYEFAKATLGNKNFFGPEDWSEFFGVKFSEAELKKIMHFPWSPHVLNNSCPFSGGMGKIHNTHFAFLGIANMGGVPLTIKKWSELYPRTSESLTISFYDSVLEELFFTKETCEFRWYLSKICPVGDRDRFSDQIRKLPPEYEPSRAIEELTKKILVFVKNGCYEGLCTHARCKDIVKNSYLETHSTVSNVNKREGFFTTPFISVENHDNPTYYGGTTGFEPPLAVSRKLPSL